MQFQVCFALLAVAACFVAAVPEENKPASSSSVEPVAAADRSKRGLLAAPLVASPYAAAPYAAAPYVAAGPYATAPYVAAGPYAAAPYAAAPYAAAPYVAAPYAAAPYAAIAAPYVTSYTRNYPYVAKTLASPYAYYR